MKCWIHETWQICAILIYFSTCVLHYIYFKSVFFFVFISCSLLNVLSRQRQLWLSTTSWQLMFIHIATLPLYVLQFISTSFFRILLTIFICLSYIQCCLWVSNILSLIAAFLFWYSSELPHCSYRPSMVFLSSFSRFTSL